MCTMVVDYASYGGVRQLSVCVKTIDCGEMCTMSRHGVSLKGFVFSTDCAPVALTDDSIIAERICLRRVGERICRRTFKPASACSGERI